VANAPQGRDQARALPPWLAPLATATLLAGFVAYSFIERWGVLASSPFPFGVDGYYYPVQLRSLLETGALAYPASPLAFWLLAPLAAATDPITGAKLGAALYGALVALPAYGIGARLGRGRGPGLVAAALATFSAGSMYLTIEFVKNGIGITVALAALWLVLRALETPARGRIALAVLGGIAALLTHKLAAGLVIALAVPAVLAEAVGRGRLFGRRLLVGLALAVLGIAGLLLASLLLGRRLLSLADAALLAELFTTTPDWTLPVLATDRGSLRLGHEVWLGLAAALIAGTVLAVDRPKRPTGERVIAWGVVVLGVAIACPVLAVDDPQGLGMRLRIVAFVPLALGAAIACRLLRPRMVRGLACAVVVALAVLRSCGSRTEGRVVAHPAMIAAMHALADKLPEDGVAIVPERHLAFMAAWYARVPVALRPESVPAERRWRVMPRAFIGKDSALYQELLAVRDTAPSDPKASAPPPPEPAVSPPSDPRASALPPAEPAMSPPSDPGASGPPIGLHPRDPNGLVLVPEATWQHVLARLPPLDRARFAAWPTI
jgi:hypothetical protein